jgi:hypothetical protein
MSSDDAGIAREWLDEAVEAFHVALDADTERKIAHGRTGQWVNDNAYAIVGALLAGGWEPPLGQDVEG